MFTIDVIFKSEKHWTSFDVGEREFVDDSDADIKVTIHDRSSL